ncbi:hypothetical protein CDAR_274471 [Caerostris darwini]|uniref:Uncharacterized protein n=1 Tax=Caerostris darwini TaxID=1538125 RepID=A0AAV4RFD4_9ARAC|nr:hypothetical protein CDAR_274471 [Caerostris darwini]
MRFPERKLVLGTRRLLREIATEPFRQHQTLPSPPHPTKCACQSAPAGLGRGGVRKRQRRTGTAYRWEAARRLCAPGPSTSGSLGPTFHSPRTIVGDVTGPGDKASGCGKPPTGQEMIRSAKSSARLLDYFSRQALPPLEAIYSFR